MFKKKNNTLLSAITLATLMSLPVQEANAQFIIFDWAQNLKIRAHTLYDEIRHSERIAQIIGQINQDFLLAKAKIQNQNNIAANQEARGAQVLTDIQNLELARAIEPAPNACIGFAGAIFAAQNECSALTKTQEKLEEAIQKIIPDIALAMGGNEQNSQNSTASENSSSASTTESGTGNSEESAGGSDSSEGTLASIDERTKHNEGLAESYNSFSNITKVISNGYTSESYETSRAFYDKYVKPQLKQQEKYEEQIIEELKIVKIINDDEIDFPDGSGSVEDTPEPQLTDNMISIGAQLFELLISNFGSVNETAPAQSGESEPAVSLSSGPSSESYANALQRYSYAGSDLKNMVYHSAVNLAGPGGSTTLTDDQQTAMGEFIGLLVPNYISRFPKSTNNTSTANAIRIEELRGISTNLAIKNSLWSIVGNKTSPDPQTIPSIDGMLEQIIQEYNGRVFSPEGEYVGNSDIYEEGTIGPVTGWESSGDDGLPDRFNSPEEFVDKLLPLAQEAADELGVDPSVLLAQAALETGWGKHMTGNSKNVFNIKSHGWGGRNVQVQTLEYRDGVAAKEGAKFRGYNSYADSFKDYVHFLKTNPIYRKALASTDDPQLYLHELQKAGYATDPLYAKKIGSIYNRISGGKVPKGSPGNTGGLGQLMTNNYGYATSLKELNVMMRVEMFLSYEEYKRNLRYEQLLALRLLNKIKSIPYRNINTL